MKQWRYGTLMGISDSGHHHDAAKTFYYLALGAFFIALLSNQPEYFHNKLWDLITLDTATVIIILTSFLLYLRKRFPFRLSSAVFIYGTVINLSISIWLYYFHNLFFSGNFLLHTIIFSIYLVLSGFCAGRKHIYIVAIIYVASYVPLIFVSRDEFLLRNLIILPFLIIVYSLAVSSLIYLLNRSHKREMELREAILEKERVLSEEKNRWLNLQLEAGKREIVANSMFLLEHVRNNNDFIYKLNFLKERLNSSDQAQLQKIIEDHRSEHFTKHWKDFEASFLDVNPEFYRRLDKVCPDLSPTQRKLAALIHLGLSSKQIGSIISISTQSVEVARSRLRSRLMLPADVSLTGFLHSI